VPAELQAAESMAAGRTTLPDATTGGTESAISAVIDKVTESVNSMPASRLEIVLSEPGAGRIILSLYRTPAGSDLVIRAVAPATYELLKSNLADIEAGIAPHGVLLKKLIGGSRAKRKTPDAREDADIPLHAGGQNERSADLRA